MEYIQDLQPDVVVTAKFSQTTLADVTTGLTNDEAVALALASSWRTLGQSGIPVVAIAYTPRFPSSIPDCVSTPGKQINDCSLDRAVALSRFDHIRAAGKIYSQAIIADLNDYICQGDMCPPVIGNVLVYRDSHHLTATYARTLDSALGPFIREAVKTDIGTIEPDTVTLDIDLPANLLKLVPDRANYPGALTLVSSEDVDDIARLVKPSLDRLRRDFHPVFRNGCYSGSGGTDVVSCELGTENAEREIVVVGDNAAAMWLPALELYADMRGIKITTYLKSGCPFTTKPTLHKGQPNLACVTWGDEVMKAVNRIQPDLLITASYATNIAVDPESGESGKAALARGISTRLSQIESSTTDIVVMAQIPTQRTDLVECLERAKGDAEIWMAAAKNLGRCAIAKSEATRREDPMTSVAAELQNVELFDFTAMFCSSTSCPVIQGGILTYKDSGHVTETYMSTLAPVLGLKIDEMLGFEVP